MVTKQTNVMICPLDNLLFVINDFPQPFRSNNQYIIAYYRGNIKVPRLNPHLI